MTARFEIQPNLIYVKLRFGRRSDNFIHDTLETYQRIHPFARIQIQRFVSMQVEENVIIPPKMSMAPFLCAMAIKPTPARDEKVPSLYKFARHPLFEQNLLPIIFAFAASPHIKRVYGLDFQSWRIGQVKSPHPVYCGVETHNPYTKQLIGWHMEKGQIFY